MRRLVEAEVVGNFRNQIHQTWGPYFWRPLFMSSVRQIRTDLRKGLCWCGDPGPPGTGPYCFLAAAKASRKRVVEAGAIGGGGGGSAPMCILGP